MGQMSSNRKIIEASSSVDEQSTNTTYKLISREDVKKALNGDTEYENIIISDVLKIVNDGYKYSPRGLTEEYRIPEDISTGIALTYFGVDAYKEE
jgi:hypothetical protein